MTDLVMLSLREEPPGTSVVEAVGEIDMSNCHELDLALETADGATHVVVDMSRCTFFDSSCLAVLARHANRLRDDGKRLTVLVDEQGRRTIELTKLGDLLGLNGKHRAD